MDVVLEGGTGFRPSNVHVVGTGAVGYIPPNWAVYEEDGDAIKVFYI